jgi:nucleotide-binding universal stress UspA family protein
MIAIDRILVPVDFSACSQAACEHAAFFATRFGAAVDLLHVWDAPTPAGPAMTYLAMGAGGETDPELGAMVEEQARKALGQLVAAFEQRVRPVRGRLEMGVPAEVIVRVAAEGKYGLVVMGTHGRTGFSRLIMGSVAEKVVRGASCPVLTVRSPDEKAAQSFPAVVQEGQAT